MKKSTANESNLRTMCRAAAEERVASSSNQPISTLNGKTSWAISAAAAAHPSTTTTPPSYAAAQRSSEIELLCGVFLGKKKNYEQVEEEEEAVDEVSQ